MYRQSNCMSKGPCSCWPHPLNASPLHPPDDHEPIATTPTHEADQGHMSGAEEAPPTSNPTPAVVPSPDDSAKEVMERDIDVIGDDDDSILGVGEANGSLQLDAGSNESKSGGDADSLGDITIDPSYNPNGEELLYEGDIEAEAPIPKEKDAGGSQDGLFMINVHETGMELESLSDSHSKGATADGEKGSGKHSSSPHWRSGEGGASKTAPSSSKSTSSDSKRSSSKDVDRFVHCIGLLPLSSPSTGQAMCKQASPFIF